MSLHTLISNVEWVVSSLYTNIVDIVRSIQTFVFFGPITSTLVYLPILLDEEKSAFIHDNMSWLWFFGIHKQTIQTKIS